MKWWIKSGIILVIALSVSAAPTPEADEEDSLRLPGNSIPLSYELSLWASPHTSRRAFNGTVRITIQITENSNRITLHNKELLVESVVVKDSGSNEMLQMVTYEPAKDFMQIHILSRQLIAGERITVEITYTGLIQTNMLGFYQSTYTVDNKTR